LQPLKDCCMTHPGRRLTLDKLLRAAVSHAQTTQ